MNRSLLPVVFIDSSVPNAESLRLGVSGGVEAIMLSPNQDGISKAGQSIGLSAGKGGDFSVVEVKHI